MARELLFVERFMGRGQRTYGPQPPHPSRATELDDKFSEIDLQIDDAGRLAAQKDEVKQRAVDPEERFGPVLQELGRITARIMGMEQPQYDREGRLIR